MENHGITVENQSVVPYENNSKCWIALITYIYIYIYKYIEIWKKDCMYKPPKCFKGITEKTMGKPWDNNGKPWDSCGKPKENHRRTVEKAWDNYGKLYENHKKTLG